jgi:hypothetical protein
VFGNGAKVRPHAKFVARATNKMAPPKQGPVEPTPIPSKSISSKTQRMEWETATNGPDLWGSGGGGGRSEPFVLWQTNVILTTLLL